MYLLAINVHLSMLVQIKSLDRNAIIKYKLVD
jgi:hypothetical protein